MQIASKVSPTVHSELQDTEGFFPLKYHNASTFYYKIFICFTDPCQNEVKSYHRQEFLVQTLQNSKLRLARAFTVKQIRNDITDILIPVLASFRICLMLSDKGDMVGKIFKIFSGFKSAFQKRLLGPQKPRSDWLSIIIICYQLSQTARLF